MKQTQHMPLVKNRQTFWRTLLTFAITRVVIAVVLLLYLLLSLNKMPGAPGDYLLYWQTCIAYLLLGAGFVALAIKHRRHILLQLWIQVVVDIIVISILYVTAGGMKSGLAILYLFPLAGSAVLAPVMPALFFAAVVTIFLLIESGYRMLVFAAGPAMSQAGLYGAVLFFAVMVINRLAARLIEEEALARQRGIDLQVQEAINRLVIADMGDGIVVVDAEGTILTVNPAAERMLGLALPLDRACRLNDIATLLPIADAFLSWMTQSPGRAELRTAVPGFVLIKPSEDAMLHASATTHGGRRELAFHLKLRFASVEMTGLADERTVIFLQDVTEIENRAQQLKLASMGRLTASIAHEVRNPLSAIAHASSLLAEEVTNNPMQRRLLHIVGDNVARLNRMIEDILQLSRKAQLSNEPLVLAPFIDEILDEFKESHAMPDGMVALGDMTDYHVWFDQLHLREVLTNLLSNALRYASGKPGSIRIFAIPDAPQRIELHVQDDGAPITPEVRAHLFEPFYTTSSKGTGLGLYLARELCLNNGAIIDYEYRTEIVEGGPEDANGRFVITLAAAKPHY